jgi:hypothetical protein
VERERNGNMPPREREGYNSNGGRLTRITTMDRKGFVLSTKKVIRKQVKT